MGQAHPPVHPGKLGVKPGCYTDSVLFPQLLLTLVLLVVCSFAPGFFFVRRLRWSGLEKLCGSIALSLVLLWLASWGIYILAPPAAYFGLAAVCGVAGHDRRQRRRAPVRRLAGPPRDLPVSFLLAWTLLVLAVIRNYSGALWGGDWMEHFQRTAVLPAPLPQRHADLSATTCCLPALP